jgi:hypothetical protein
VSRGSIRMAAARWTVSLRSPEGAFQVRSGPSRLLPRVQGAEVGARSAPMRDSCQTVFCEPTRERFQRTVTLPTPSVIYTDPAREPWPWGPGDRSPAMRRSTRGRDTDEPALRDEIERFDRSPDGVCEAV